MSVPIAMRLHRIDSSRPQLTSRVRFQMRYDLLEFPIVLLDHEMNMLRKN